MAAAKDRRREPSLLVQTIRALLRPQYRGLVLSAAAIIIVAGGALWAWQRFGAPSVRTADYVVTPERIEVTPQPPWIRTSVKDEVIRTAGIVQLDLRQPKLVEQIAHSFALHPWVAKVRVEKRVPARVLVELSYRRPVAAVPVVHKGEARLLFVDEQCVLLPTADFDANQSKDYLRIANASEMPAGVYGTPWGSDRIAGAARIAAAWRDRWQALGLYQIDAINVPGKPSIYELRTQRGTRVIWGAAPAAESGSEPAAEKKIAALERWVQENGPLDGNSSTAIDLRQMAASNSKTTAKAASPVEQQTR